MEHTVDERQVKCQERSSGHDDTASSLHHVMPLQLPSCLTLCDLAMCKYPNRLRFDEAYKNVFAVRQDSMT